MSSKQLIYGCLVNSQNHCPEGTTTTMTMVDYCPRPMAERNSPSGHPRHRGAVVKNFDYSPNSHGLTVLLPKKSLSTKDHEH